MAKYRSISDEILYNDNFLSLPASARDLYNYINNKTDDYGFCCEVQSIIRTVRAKPKDLQLLIDKKYIIKLEDWLYLEKHFNINNRNLRKDRRKKSNYMEYFNKITVKEDGVYSLRQNDTKCQPNDDILQPNDRVNQINTNQYNTNQINSNQINTAEELKAFLRGR